MEIFRTVGAEDMAEEDGPGSNSSDGLMYDHQHANASLEPKSKATFSVTTSRHKCTKLVSSCAFGHFHYAEHADARDTKGKKLCTGRVKARMVAGRGGDSLVGLVPDYVTRVFGRSSER